MVGLRQPKETLVVDNIPAPVVTRRRGLPEAPSACLPMWRLCLAPQRHLCPRPDRPGAAAGATLAVQGVSGQRLTLAARHLMEPDPHVLVAGHDKHV